MFLVSRENSMMAEEDEEVLRLKWDYYTSEQNGDVPNASLLSFLFFFFLC